MTEFGGIHAPSRAGQNFESFDSILGSLKKLPHKIIVCAYSMYGNAKRLIETRNHHNVNLLIATFFFSESDSEPHSEYFDRINPSTRRLTL